MPWTPRGPRGDGALDLPPHALPPRGPEAQVQFDLPPSPLNHAGGQVVCRQAHVIDAIAHVHAAELQGRVTNFSIRTSTTMQ